MVRGELEGGRSVSEITVVGRCTSIPLNAVGYGENCDGDLTGSCTNPSLCLNVTGGFCGEPCRNTRDCQAGSVCFGIGMTEMLEAGTCVESRLLGMPDASLTTCRRDADCGETEHCGLNTINSATPVVETLCMTNVGAGEAGSECTSDMDCQAEMCRPVSTDNTVPATAWRPTIRRRLWWRRVQCERQVMESDSGAEAKFADHLLRVHPVHLTPRVRRPICSQVNYGSSGVGNGCLASARAQATTAAVPISRAHPTGDNGIISNNSFVCTPNNAIETCSAALPR